MKIELKVKELREINHLTMLQLSIPVEVSEAYISEIESGKKIPSLEVTCKLAKTLKCSLSDLVKYYD
jgi:transcriptional regulator with XRE-family HTH domain